VSAKSDLLDEITPLLVKEKKLDSNYFLSVILIISLICVFLFPKVYIQQQIYFKSRDISKLKSEYDILREENKRINASVEAIKFKNQILDTLF